MLSKLAYWFFIIVILLLTIWMMVSTARAPLY
jgi:hypothetical protein